MYPGRACMIFTRKEMKEWLKVIAIVTGIYGAGCIMIGVVAYLLLT